MQIADNTVVTIHYTLTDTQGQVLDSSQEDEAGEPLSYLHGAGIIVPGLEAALLGKSEGDHVKVTLAPEGGYGPHQESLVEKLPRDQFPDGEIEVGMHFRSHGPHGGRVLTVVGVDKDNVTVDGNHPLAGATLNFDVAVVSVREATPEDLQCSDHDDHGDHGGHGGHECGGCGGCGGH